MKKLDLEDLGAIYGILNHAGEKIDLAEPLVVTMNLEQWMQKLEFCMKHAVSMTLLECYRDYEKKKFRVWITSWPTQFLVAVLDVKMAERFSIIFP